MTEGLVVLPIESVRELVREEVERALARHAPGAAVKPAGLELLDVLDVVTFCNSKVTPERVRSWCRTGRLPARKEGRSYLIEKAALIKFLATGPLLMHSPPTDPQAEANRILKRVRGG